MTKNTELNFDLNDLFLSETAELHLDHPRDDGSKLYAPVAKDQPEDSRPVTLTVYGSASAQYRKAMEVMHKKTNARGKRLASADEVRNESVDFLVAVSVKFDNITFDGEIVETQAAFRKIYSNPKWDWLTKQVTQFVFTDSNFLGKSKSN